MTFDMKPTPLWISHRGYKEKAAGNTLSAFKSAAALGFDALETDLRTTTDRHIVLSHDLSLKRLFGVDAPVERFSRRELAELRTAGGDGLLFLDDFAEMFVDLYWVFDIKPESGEKTIHALARWADAAGMEQHLVSKTKFLTWKETHERLIRSFFPGAAFYARPAECWRAGLSVMAGLPPAGGIRPGRTYALPPAFIRIPLYRRSMVRPFKARGAQTVAFLPETDAEAAAAAVAGFDEILTNGKRLEPGGTVRGEAEKQPFYEGMRF